jgi:prepilin-type N-terminal cleavage/methylation domain-containing protein
MAFGLRTANDTLMDAKSATKYPFTHTLRRGKIMMRQLAKARKSNQKGFTLVELMIVVAIIGILAAIAIPQFAKYRARAQNSSSVSDMRNLKTDLEGYHAEWMGYPN